MKKKKKSAHTPPGAWESEKVESGTGDVRETDILTPSLPGSALPHVPHHIACAELRGGGGGGRKG